MSELSKKIISLPPGTHTIKAFGESKTFTVQQGKLTPISLKNRVILIQQPETPGQLNQPPSYYHIFGKQSIWWSIKNLEETGKSYKFYNGDSNCADIRYPMGAPKSQPGGQNTLDFHLYHSRDCSSDGRNKYFQKDIAIIIPPQAWMVSLDYHDNFRVPNPGRDILCFSYGNPPPDFGYDDIEYSLTRSINTDKSYKDDEYKSIGKELKDLNSTGLNSTMFTLFRERPRIFQQRVLAGSYISADSSIYRNFSVAGPESRRDSYELEPPGDYLYIRHKIDSRFGTGRMWYFKITLFFHYEFYNDLIQWLGEYNPNGFDPEKGITG